MRSFKTILGVYFLCFNSFLPVFAQLKGLEKEAIKQTSEDGIYWTNQSKYDHAYDAYGNSVSDQTYYWDDASSSWKLTYDVKSVYSQDGLLLKENRRKYDQKSGELINETKTDNSYHNGLLVHFLRQNDDKKSNNDWQDELILTYDEQNRIVDREEVYKQNGLDSYGSKQHFEYNEDGCLVLKTDISHSAGSYGEVYVKTDFVRNSRCEITDRIERDRKGIVHLHWKWEWEYDAEGLPVHIIHYRNMYEGYFYLAKYSEAWITYDNALTVDSTYTEPGATRRLLYGYDGKGRRSFSRQEKYDSLDKEWHTIHMDTTHFDDTGRVIYNGYRNFSISDTDSLNAEIFYQQFFYDEDGFRYRIIYHSEAYRPEQINGHWETVKFNTTETDDYTDRCDGVPSELNIYSEDTGSNPGKSFIRENYTYYDLAACEEIPDQAHPIVIFPNPANTYFNIFKNVPIGQCTLQIVDRNGNIALVKKLDMKNYQPVDVSSLASGLYVVKINNDIEHITTRLVIIR